VAGHEQQYPKVSDSQKIGQMADQCFQANRPTEWLLVSMDGDTDFGYDFTIQIPENAEVKWTIKGQLKGTTSPARNTTGEFISFQLKATTLRLYANTSEPILLVLADVGVAPRPKDCPLYYVWIEDEIRRVRDENSGEIPDQATVTIRIPVHQILENETNLISEISAKNRITLLGKALNEIVEKKHPELDQAAQRALTEQIPFALQRRSVDFLDSLVEPSATVWPEPKVGTRSWFLSEAEVAVRAGRLVEAADLLARANKHTDQLSKLDEAESLFLHGKILSFRDHHEEAAKHYWKAHELAPQAAKYLAAWAEMQLRLSESPNDAHDFSSILAMLTGNSPCILAVKVRLLAAEKKYDDALAVAETMTEGRHAAAATVNLMRSDFEEALAISNEGLGQSPLKDRDRYILLLLRARARFYIGTNYKGWANPDDVYPVMGTLDTDISVLRSAWGDTLLLIERYRQENWPPNTDFISDLWCSISCFLGKQREALPLLKEAAKARNSVDLNSALEIVAGLAHDYQTALSANGRLPESSTQILRRLLLLYSANKYSDYIDLLSAKLDLLEKSHPLFGPAMIMGASAAEKILKVEVAKEWIKILSTTPELAEDYAAYQFDYSVTKHPSSKPSAINRLREDYQRLAQPAFLGMHLMQELDSTDKNDAAEICEIAAKIETGKRLPIDCRLQLAQAYSTLGAWETVLQIATRALEQNETHSRFKGIKAFALDRLGKTVEARDLLQQLIEEGEEDPYALNAYLNIVGRSGFIDQAIALVEKILTRDTERSRHLQCLQLLFNLLYYQDPLQPRVLEVLWAFGQKVNQREESEEGSFLLKWFLVMPAVTDLLTEEQRSEIHTRFERFFADFPSSKIFRRGEIPDGGDPHAILSSIEKLIGVTAEQKNFFRKMENQMRTGEIPVPYAWRPRQVLQNIPDIPFLWETAKRSRTTEKQYHLSMVTNDFIPTKWDAIKGRIPLLDLTSLLVLQDLDLLRKLVQLFQKVAISQETIAQIGELVRPMTGTVFRKRIEQLRDFIRDNFESIEQPSSLIDDEEPYAERNPDTYEIKALTKSGKYLLFSDDCLQRIYCEIPVQYQPSICTLDFLSIMEERGLMTEKEAAQKIALLCKWKVHLVVQARYFIAALPNQFHVMTDVRSSIAMLSGDSDFRRISDALWDISLPYQGLLQHMASIAAMLVNQYGFKSYQLAAYLISWTTKTILRTDSKLNRTGSLIQAVSQTAIYLGDATSENMPIQMKVLVDAFLEAIAFGYGEKMDEKLEDDALRELASASAKSDHFLRLEDEQTLKTKFLKGMTPGTHYHQVFLDAYSSTVKQNLRMS
jgi:tetratricopeptide (TPR) repeat protein